jgi:hypothetical protein
MSLRITTLGGPTIRATAFALAAVAAALTGNAAVQEPARDRIPGRQSGFTALVQAQGDEVIVMAGDGTLVARASNKQTAAMIQKAVDLCAKGGEIRIAAGRYPLEKSVVVDYPCTISGEGRGTILVPPLGDYALRMMRTGRSPILTDWVWGTKRGKIPKALNDLCAVRLYGVHIRSLAIIGDGHGKGIYLNELSECSCADLWIHTTEEGAALYLDSTVMETDFHNIHCYNTGSLTNREAALVIASQAAGDSNNNLHFDKVYILLPNYIGVEIGTEAGKRHPRLIYFTQSFFHGWLPVSFAPPCDLFLVRHTFPERGVTVSDSRFTNSGPRSSIVSVEEGAFQAANCSFGGGAFAGCIHGAPGTRLNVTGCTFHGGAASACSLWANRSHVIFSHNSLLEAAKGLRLESPASAVVTDNVFGAARAQAILLEPPEPSDSTVIGQNVFNASAAPR